MNLENFVGKTLAEVAETTTESEKGYSVFILQSENDILGREIDEDVSVQRILNLHPEIADYAVKYTNDFFGISVLRVFKTNTTTDVAEVKHGYWNRRHRGNGWDDWDDITCSVCDTTYEKPQFKAFYCPNCGAKMDGKGD